MVTIDRGRIRRDAEQWANVPGLQLADMGRHCLALLTELEQAERERDRLASKLREYNATDLARYRATESRLAKVPAPPGVTQGNATGPQLTGDAAWENE